MTIDFDTDFEDDFAWHESITFEDYATEAMGTAIYPDQLIYPVLGLVSEAGEVADKVKKHYRDNEFELNCEDAVAELPAQLRLSIANELGDVLWYLTAIASDIGYELDEIASLNIDKLHDRAKRNQLKGSGDNR